MRLIIAVTTLLATTLSAQPRLVRDINVRAQPASSQPGGLATIGSTTFFFADANDLGNELWATDGTAAGTRLVRDIRLGESSGVPTNRLGAPVLGSRILFVANDGTHGLELWASDGTQSGTVMLADIMPGRDGSEIRLGSIIGTTMYFIATSPTAGAELWRTDGTPGGTRMVVDLHPGTQGSHPLIVGSLGTQLFFTATDGANTGIFRTDGTAEGTKYVIPYVGWPATKLGNELLFVAGDTRGGWIVMKTDGTREGTTLVRDGFVGQAPDRFRVIGNVAYFLANDGASGTELWRTDGTTAGTSLVADLTPGEEGSQIAILWTLGERLIFHGDGQLWVSDGTREGTRAIKATPGASLGFVIGNHYYFAWDDDAHGRELWRSDGTSEGTALFADLAPGKESSLWSSYIVRRGDGGFFFAADDGDSGFEPWVSDGTAAGTRMVRNLAPEVALGSNPERLANVGGKLFFTAHSGHSYEIWTSDGTTAGTRPLETQTPDTPYLRDETGVVSGGLYYFVAGDTPRLELWRTDGTINGTFRLFTMNESRTFASLVPFKGGVFFQGADEEHGVEPWFTDGTVAGTRLVKDINPGSYGSYGYADGAAVAGDYVYFGASGEDGRRPWRSDGTAAGTKQLTADGEAATPRAFTRVGDWVYFAAYLHDAAFALWRTNIATGETMRIRRFDGRRAPWAMWDAGGALLFTLSGELWRSDGTEAGTTLVRGSIPTPSCFNREDFAVGDGILYWYVMADYAPELWRSDGTTAGTFRLGRFEGSFSHSLQNCLPHDLHYSDGRLYFIGNDDVHGAEPWVSDGTIAGTRLLYDVDPGIAPSDPASFLTIGNTLYFTADERTAGRELWALCIADCSARRRAVRP